MRVLQRRLEKIKQQRDTGRAQRAEIPVPSVALVGYTNAGKSTLFRSLTGADAYVADQLFATLDPTVRRITLPGGTPVVVADTVGFIRELPHELVAALQSTLTEARQATLRFMSSMRATRAAKSTSPR
jgi:GTP-binding protein HflX